MKEANRNRHLFWLGLAGFIVIIALGGILLYGVARVIQQFLVFLKGLDAQVATQIIAASGTIITAVVTVVVGQLIAKNREIREAHRKRKTELYNSFLEMVKEIMEAGDMAIEDQFVDRMRSFNSDLILWGSPGVIRAYHKWNTEAQTLGGGKPTAIFAVDKLYRAFRRDLGLSNKSLGKGDLIRLYLKPGEMEKMKESPNL